MYREKTREICYSDAEYISVVTNNICSRIHISDIAMAEQDGRKLLIVLKDGEEFSCYAKLSDISQALDKYGLYKVMESMYISFDAVNKVEDRELSFFCGKTCTFGRNNFIKMRQAYKKYLRSFPPYTVDVPIEDAEYAEAVKNADFQNYIYSPEVLSEIAKGFARQ